MGGRVVGMGGAVAGAGGTGGAAAEAGAGGRGLHMRHTSADPVTVKTQSSHSPPVATRDQQINVSNRCVGSGGGVTE